MKRTGAKNSAEAPGGTEAHRLEIDSLAYGGDGVARWDGRVAFVPGALPGDVVSAHIAQDKGTYLRAALDRVEEPSPDRIEPFCPLADRCGGCQWQELSYPAQLRWKHAIVEESLRRLGGFADIPVGECLPSPVERGWRTVARFPSAVEGGRFVMGYFGRRSHRIVDVPSCPVASDRVNRIAEAVRGLPGIERAYVREVTVRASWNHPSALVSLLVGRHTDLRSLAAALIDSGAGVDGVALWIGDSIETARRLKTFGASHRFEKVNSRAFRIDERSFFQVNIPQAERLAALAADALRMGEGTVLTDGYGGVGLFSLGCAPDTTDVRLFDTAEWAVDDASHNARELGFGRFAGHAGGAKEAVEAFGPSGRLVIDPPRTGLGLAAVEAAVRFGAERIAYVSCNPTTLARDLRLFAERGYTVVRATPVDMFPHTYHIETVAELERG